MFIFINVKKSQKKYLDHPKNQKIFFKKLFEITKKLKKKIFFYKFRKSLDKFLINISY